MSPLRPGEEPLERRAIISGIGQSDVGRRLGRSDLDLTVEAAEVAIADAGLTRDDIDGLSTYPGMGAGTARLRRPVVARGARRLGPLAQLARRRRRGRRRRCAPCTRPRWRSRPGLARHVLVYRTVTEGSAQGTGGRQGIGGGWRRAVAACRASASFMQWSHPLRRRVGGQLAGHGGPAPHARVRI